MENNDFVTSAENIYTGDAYISNLSLKVSTMRKLARFKGL